MVRDRKTDKPGEPARRLALKFISGKYQGGEFPLNEGQDVVVGRSSELDMVLVEEMVSRKHAVFRLESGVLTVQDLGSTNGTFVNGERIEKATLREGDRVLVGTSILRVIGVDASLPMPVKKGLMGETQKHIVGQHPVNEPPESQEPPRMSGNLEEIPLPDLMQLFSTSKKTGVLVLRSPDRVGRLHLEQGRIRFAEVDTNPALAPERAVYRLLSFTKGLFSLDPPENRSFEKTLDLSATEVLMEGFRQQDEINALGGVPGPRVPLHLTKQPPGRLRDLSPEELDWLELALRGRTLEGALDLSTRSDLDTVKALLGLVNKGWLASG